MASQRGLITAIAVLGVGTAMLGLAAFAADLEMGSGFRQGLAIAGAVTALIAGPLAVSLAKRHATGLRLLRTALQGIGDRPERVLAKQAPPSLDADLADLWTHVSTLSARQSPELQQTRRLADILAALPQPVLVITAQGLVTLANQPAIDLLGGGQLAPGTSVFDAIDRASFASQTQRADPGQSIAVDLELTDGTLCKARLRALPDDGGIVIAIDAEPGGETGLVHALDLHDSLPPRTAPRPDTALEALDVVVLDCETTGLNVGLDRLISLGAVRLHGERIGRPEIIDVLVNPGEAIPPASTAIHGITDAMIRQARPLVEQWAEIEPMLRDCVVVGHNIGFDLTLLEIELRRAGVSWQRPPSLCTLQLASALDPQLQDLNLETLAQTYGIAVTGRHTALGDALVTAEVYLHLLALMKAKGDRTLSDAQARAATARRVIRQQQAAGW